MPHAHLAILTLDFPPQVGGVQNYLYEVAKRLGKQTTLTVITPVLETLPADAYMQKRTVSSRFFWHFLQTTRQIKPDLIIVGHAHPQLLLAAKLSGKRFTAVAYGNDFLAAQKRWHRPLFNKLLRQARPLITISQANATKLQELGLPKPIIIYPGTNPDQFVPKAKTAKGSLTLLTVGRLVPRKGIDTTLQAVAQLRKNYPNLQYQIAGTGDDLPRLKQLVKELGLETAVTFLGYIPSENLPELYQNAGIFVMPSRERPQVGSIEGFGIVYLEASASGLPVVASHSGGAAEAVRHGETGLLVPPDNVTALAKTLDSLLQNSELRQKLGRNGRRWVEDRMNWDRAAAQFWAALQGEIPS